MLFVANWVKGVANKSTQSMVTVGAMPFMCVACSVPGLQGSSTAGWFFPRRVVPAHEIND